MEEDTKLVCRKTLIHINKGKTGEDTNKAYLGPYMTTEVNVNLRFGIAHCTVLKT